LSSKVSLFPSGVQAAGAVLKGDVAAAYVLRSQAEAAVLQGGGTVRTAISPLPMAGLPPNGWPIGMAIKKNFKDLGQALEVSLNALRASGELLAIFKLHGLTLTAP
ncbi:MAG: ABC transporter permease, partial [Rhodoferax sp.]|nr:ABC transporter permease [Rhodoferax sp.]